jgi:hypothetical protein
VISFNTVQELIDGGYKLYAYCHNSRCQHNQMIDLAKLRERLGPDHLTMHDDLVPKLKCSKCGGKQIGLINTRLPPRRAGSIPTSSRRVSR